jgi:hypothetical protein
MKYIGNFDSFSEMGSEGVSFMFQDEKAKYLSGYETLELSYFFKRDDLFIVSVFDNTNLVYQGPLSFQYSSKYNTLIPKEIDFKAFNLWVNKKYTVHLNSSKKLYEDKIILKANNLETDFLLSQIEHLMKTPSSKLSPKMKSYKQQFNNIKKYIKKLYNNEKSFDDYISSPQEFLFGSTPIEVVLRGDGVHLVKWLKERAG